MNGKIWERSEIKERAKVAVKRNYWWCVLAAIFLAMILGGFGGGNGKDDDDGDFFTYVNLSDYDFSKYDLSKYDFSKLDFSEWKDKGVQKVGDYLAKMAGGGAYQASKLAYGALNAVFGLIMVLLVIVAVVIGILVKALLVNPLEVGGRKYFMENQVEEKKGVGCFLDAFRCGFYGNVMVTMIVRDVKIFLWSLLLIVPGIIKAYEYRLVPYVLAEHPELNYREALERSQKLMDGQKMNAFVLDLSFIGWNILSGITAGILGVFWVNPYVYATDAELYLVLSDDAERVE